MPIPENVVNVSREWFQRVETLLKSIEAQIKENGVPFKPGLFRVELTNDTEAQLKQVIRDITIQHAVEKAVREMEQNEAEGGSGGST